VRIGSFNLESLDDETEDDRAVGDESGGAEAAPFAARYAVLRPQLRRMAADILCLQEVHGQRDPRVAGDEGPKAPRRLRALDRLLDGTPYADFHRVETVNRAGSGALDVHNLAILSRYPIRAHAQVWHDFVPPPVHGYLTADPAASPGTAPAEQRWDRPILWATIGLPGGERLHVVNLHLRAPLAAAVPGQKAGAFAWRSTRGWAEGFWIAAMKRAGQALEARLLVDELFDGDPDAMIAVAGDCNAELRETALRLLCADPADTGNGALAGRALLAVEAALPADRRHTVIHGGRPVMLDHLLASRRLMGRFQGCEIHNEALGDELVAAANLPGTPESFHAPLVAEFNLS